MIVFQLLSAFAIGSYILSMVFCIVNSKKGIPLPFARTFLGMYNGFSVLGYGRLRHHYRASKSFSEFAPVLFFNLSIASFLGIFVGFLGIIFWRLSF